MSFDSIGIFWEDDGRRQTNKVKLDNAMPPIPETGWTKPNQFPDISSAVAIALDTETFDPELEDCGPGWARGVGHLVGVSIAAKDKFGNTDSWYFPMRHETQPEDNMDPASVIAWLKEALSDPSQPKIGANLTYDIGWLKQEGVSVKGELVDVQYAEALLDESARVGLDVLAKKYLGVGKETELMYEWLAQWFGGEPNGRQRKWLYKTPPKLAGPYAISDADLPLRLAEKFCQLLIDENLLDLFRVECRLIPLMVAMRFAGVSVDVGKTEELYEKLTLRQKDKQQELNKLAGFAVNVDSANDLAKAFDKFELSYPFTEKGSPSFVKSFIENVQHPIGDLIREIKKCGKLKNTFLKSYIMDTHVNGKVYGQFHQLRGEGGGTRSGRFSSSMPNLQNIPSRDEELAPLIRGLFIPDEGHAAWRKYDYSQIEYRLLIHFAVGAAGDSIRKYFWENPETDYHVYAQRVVKEKTGISIGRKPIKNINFGLIYGMGVPTLANALGMEIEEAKQMMEAYFEGVPFAKPTMDAASEEAQKLGVIKTILGRKSRFDLWEPAKYSENRIALPFDRATREYGSNIVRSSTHKALNRKLQGTAADQMKMAMLICWESGIFDETGVPRLTVHDELDFSDPGGKDKAFKEMCHFLETAIPELNVPVKADGEIGPNWGDVKEIVD